jgi:hypothetical protein
LTLIPLLLLWRNKSQQEIQLAIGKQTGLARKSFIKSINFRKQLGTFYQRQLNFSPEYLNVLAAISTCVRPDLTTHLDSKKGDHQINTQNKIKAAGVDNQIASIISAIE